MPLTFPSASMTAAVLWYKPGARRSNSDAMTTTPASRATLPSFSVLGPGTASARGAVRAPFREDRARAWASAFLQMLVQQLAQPPIVRGLELCDGDHLQIAARFQKAPLVEHVCDAVRHPCPEVPTHGAEHDHHAAGHVLATVVARAFDHSH